MYTFYLEVDNAWSIYKQGDNEAMHKAIDHYRYPINRPNNVTRWKITDANKVETIGSFSIK